MINTVRSEWIKFRTVRVHWVLAIVAIAFPFVVVTLTSLFGDLEGGVSSSDAAELIANLTIVSGMLFGALSAISLTSEYGFNTMRPTYAATPSRLRVLGAKFGLNSVVVFAMAAFTVFGSWATSSVILAGRDNEIAIGDPTVVRRLFAVCLLAMVIAWFGFGLGLIIRNSPATITVSLVWPLIAEGLVGALLAVVGLDAVVKFLPYSAGFSAVVDGIDDSLGWPNGIFWFGAVCLVIVGLGTWLEERRDA